MSKDLFSGHANTYAKFRPAYPAALFQYLLQFLADKNRAWDCATGNGQAATALANYFTKVDATDISTEQIKNAVPIPNIEYSVCAAEQTHFADNSFDLITVAQAYHWLHWKRFENEAARVGKQNAVVAIWTYTLLKSNDEKLNQIINHFYYDTIAPYWEAERRYVDEEYKTVTFDFDPLPSKEFEMIVQWTKEMLLGYLESWSAVQQYNKKNNSSAVAIIEPLISDIWPTKDTKQICFPIFLRLGRITKPAVGE